MTFASVSSKSCALVLCGALMGAAWAQDSATQTITPMREAAGFRRMIEKGALGSSAKKTAQTFSGEIRKPFDTREPGLKGSPQRPQADQTQQGTGDPAAGTLTLRSLHKGNFVSVDSATTGELQEHAVRATTKPNATIDPRAKMISPTDGSTLAPVQTFTWSQGFGGVQDFGLWIGSCYDCRDILDEDEGLQLYRTVNLPTDGRILYVTLFTNINGHWYWVDYEFVASSTPVVPAVLTSPSNGSTVGSLQTFTWDAGYGVTGISLTIGTCFECTDMFNEMESVGGSRNVNLPNDGRVIFVTLYSFGVDGNWYWNDYQFRTPSPHPARVNITNNFVYPINIFVSGILMGSVEANRTQYVNTTASPLQVSFELVQPTLGGVALGDPVSGYWNEIDNPSGTYNFEAGYKLGATTYFLPQISNRTTVPLEIEVNGGYTAENRCNCYAPPQTENVRAGYYQLFSNSNVRLYRWGSNYTGSYRYFGTNEGSVSPSGPLYKLVQDPTGLVALADTVVP